MRAASVVAPVLGTDRLRLDPLTVDDAGEMAEVLSDPRLYEFIGGSPPDLPTLRERYLRQVRSVSPDGGERWLNWVIRDRSSGRAVGYVQATLTLSSGVADLAWVVGALFQGRGYATEGTAMALSWLETRPEVRRITAHIGAANAASVAVARRLDFRPTSTVERGETVWEHLPVRPAPGDSPS